jgi:hypothetical protein
MKIIKTHWSCIKITEGQAYQARMRRLVSSKKQPDFRSGRSFNSRNQDLLWPKLPDRI